MSAELTTSSRSTTSPDWLALAGVMLTVVFSFLMRRFGATGLFIAGAVPFWTLYVHLRTRSNRHALHTWGFRTDNLAQAALVTLLVFLAIAGGLIVYGAINRTLSFPAHLFIQLLLYPAWGIIQQFLALAIVVGNLERTGAFQSRKMFLVVATALLFGVVHLYDVGLAIGTFALELIIVPLYLNYRNLWPLGILHGWCGALYYLWVLDQDLWNEIVAGARAIVGI